MQVYLLKWKPFHRKQHLVHVTIYSFIRWPNQTTHSLLDLSVLINSAASGWLASGPALLTVLFCMSAFPLHFCRAEEKFLKFAELQLSNIAAKCLSFLMSPIWIQNKQWVCWHIYLNQNNSSLQYVCFYDLAYIFIELSFFWGRDLFMFAHATAVLCLLKRQYSLYPWLFLNYLSLTCHLKISFWYPHVICI